jgi:hypothetical protein
MEGEEGLELKKQERTRRGTRRKSESVFWERSRKLKYNTKQRRLLMLLLLLIKREQKGTFFSILLLLQPLPLIFSSSSTSIFLLYGLVHFVLCSS